MLKHLLVVAVAAVLGGIGAAVTISAGSSEAAPPIRVEDNCACGGSYPILVGNAYGQCTWDYGPYSSPRIRQAPC
jgi:hypothetical protein